MNIIIIILMSLPIGLVLGLLGGGGSILTVPVLVYGLDVGDKEAIATSLLVVGATSAFGTLSHARKGNVEWRTGAVFGVTAMVGAFLGGFAADWFSGTVLLLMFAGMMLATSFFMLKGKRPASADEPKDPDAKLPLGKVIAEGLVVGAVTGLVGAGGGFLVVPALVLLGGMQIHKAVGTSLFVITLKSFSGFAGHASHVAIDYKLAAIVAASAVVGTLVGTQFASKIPAQTLRKGFAIFVLVMAAFVIYRELPALLAAG